MAVTRVPAGAWVFLGGCAGTLLRAALGVAWPDAGFPWTTLAINLTGAFALGWLARALALSGWPEPLRHRLRLGLGTGVLGGYTTYSAFMVQAIQLGSAGRLWAAFGYVAVSLVGGGAAAGLGTILARRRRSAP